MEERELKEEIVDGSFEQSTALDDPHSIVKENAEDLRQLRTLLEDIQVENARLRKALSDAGLRATAGVETGSYPTGQAGEGANPEGERDKGESDGLRTTLRKGPVNQRTSPNSTLTCLGRLDEYIYKQTVRCIRTPRAARRSASISRPSAFPADYDTFEIALTRE